MDSVTFYPIAFLGIWESTTLVRVIVFNWVMKVMVEVVLTPVTYAVVGWLKRVEKVWTRSTSAPTSIPSACVTRGPPPRGGRTLPDSLQLIALVVSSRRGGDNKH